ncbi:MAG: hypothetical protein UV60_C0002G0079 [Parcubacteria group bacterium GW2011_GWA2_43_11]|nr:MAG: hypothetical protein UV60_C0002G0079 [Parcubacteria group bacterium GW2011_GWA2_43_11]
MKAFKDCDRRREGVCIQYRHVCTPNMEIGMGYPDGCWRMCEENEKYLQCPACATGLWFDNHVTNSLGQGNTFFCPRCNKDVDRAVAVQTKERLEKILNINKATVKEYEKLDRESCLTPRSYDTLDSARYNVKRFKRMIAELTEK